MRFSLISGTTWVQEMVWMIVNDCDFVKGKQPLNIRSPFLECVLPFKIQL